jgi:hypothetical protein
MKYILGILLLLSTTCAFAQEKERPVIQFSGIVISTDSAGNVVPYTTIVNLSYHNSTITSDYRGYFSIVVREQDTIRFSSVGYAPKTVVIPAGLKNKTYTVPVFLLSQVIQLPIVRVFPWANADDFRKDFLAMKIADDNYAIVLKNLRGTTRQAMQRDLPRDGSESIANDMHTNIVNSHGITNPLLNPFAWGALIKQITAGDKQRATTADDDGYNF